MITFSSSINIARPPEAVFDFLANVHLVQQAEGSPVLALDMTTPGPPRLGSRYREVVQLLPFSKGEFISLWSLSCANHSSHGSRRDSLESRANSKNITDTWRKL